VAQNRPKSNLFLLCEMPRRTVPTKKPGKVKSHRHALAEASRATKQPSSKLLKELDKSQAEKSKFVGMYKFELQMLY
jgi:hypothetical protein